ncbi:hypothetical protein ACFR9U_03090 [Halorientalis brevis]|uniref:Uncharacterized protein n=1 Tax=Halorientalis brevis TaxID=1126241 RepID=A0ABD6C7D0_9EURY|nr:hypothetical protein [Halorientalis brevis]
MRAGESRDTDRDTESHRQRWQDWLLLDGDRRLVVGFTTVVLFLVIASVVVSELAPLRDLQPLFYVLGGLIGGNLTVITVVVSINQLLLSRELQAPPDLESQIEGIIEYRSDVEDAAGQVAPVEPLGFLRLLFENTRREAQRLGGLATSETDEQTYEEINEVVSEITTQTDRVDSLLQQSQTSTFDVLSVTLTTNYATDINRLRQIEWEHGAQLPADVSDAVDTLVHQLQNIDIARQYFKSVYLQQELAELSRNLFYAGLPSVTVVAIGLLLLTGPSGTVFTSPYLRAFVPLFVTVGLLPITILFAYIVRIATVTQRTAATLPFTTPAQEQ